MPCLVNSGLFLRLFIDKISTNIDSLRVHVVRSACLKRLTPLSAKSDHRIIRSLVKKISKLSPQAIQPRPATYKRSHHPSQTVSLLLAMDEATCPGWKEALLSMCFTSLATECQQQRLFLDAILFSGFISDLSRRADYPIIRLLANRKISKLSPQATQPRPTSYKRSHHPSQAVSLLLATDETTCPGWKVTLLSMCFTSLATESQQQRLLRGMTIKYIAQPTFGPGLNPWGVYYLTNVLPASATFRRVPVLYPSILYEKQIYISRCFLYYLDTLAKTNLSRTSLDTTLPIIIKKIYPPLFHYGFLY